MLLDCGVGEDSWESLELQGGPTSPSYRKSVLNIHWKDWCWGWSSNTLATWYEELTHWKRRWCWKRLRAEGEGDDRGWDGWMASLTRWTWVWAGSRSWWWTGKPACSPWGHKESETTERLNWTDTTESCAGLLKIDGYCPSPAAATAATAASTSNYLKVGPRNLHSWQVPRKCQFAGLGAHLEYHCPKSPVTCRRKHVKECFSTAYS